ncbi:MAG: hypothetical protein CM1200mP12_23040 [Gammaproteobacteria bacterium]|nr:MAG: hypothetical protein CM1200mP12_23040 [Gammaproteobacteria bacterium]
MIAWRRNSNFIRTPKFGKNVKEKFPEAPAVTALVTPVGVCSTTTDAPETFTFPRNDEVVSTSENTGTEASKKVNNEEKRKNFFKTCHKDPQIII